MSLRAMMRAHGIPELRVYGEWFTPFHIELTSRRRENDWVHWFIFEAMGSHKAKLYRGGGFTRGQRCARCPTHSLNLKFGYRREPSDWLGYGWWLLGEVCEACCRLQLGGVTYSEPPLCWLNGHDSYDFGKLIDKESDAWRAWCFGETAVESDPGQGPFRMAKTKAVLV